MSDDKIKEAWGVAKLFPDRKWTGKLNDALVVLADAFVQAEARARMAEWERRHEVFQIHGRCLECAELGLIADDPRHSMSLIDYVAEVEAELSE